VPEAPDLAGYKIKTPTNSGIVPPMKFWEIVADKLSAAGHGVIAAPLAETAGVGSLTPIAKLAAILTSCIARS